MKKSKPITQSIQKISTEKDIAARGLGDLGKFYALDALQEEMLLHFKAEKFMACIRVCNKIKQIKPDDPLIKLIEIAAKSRLKEK